MTDPCSHRPSTRARTSRSSPWSRPTRTPAEVAAEVSGPTAEQPTLDAPADRRSRPPEPSRRRGTAADRRAPRRASRAETWPAPTAGRTGPSRRSRRRPAAGAATPEPPARAAEPAADRGADTAAEHHAGPDAGRDRCRRRPRRPHRPVAAAASDPALWGRVAEDGTVYVRTADGERPVGSYPGAGRTRRWPTSAGSTTSWPARSRCWSSGSAVRRGRREGRRARR